MYRRPKRHAITYCDGSERMSSKAAVVVAGVGIVEVEAGVDVCSARWNNCLHRTGRRKREAYKGQLLFCRCLSR